MENYFSAQQRPRVLFHNEKLSHSSYYLFNFYSTFFKLALMMISLISCNLTSAEKSPASAITTKQNHLFFECTTLFFCLFILCPYRSSSLVFKGCDFQFKSRFLLSNCFKNSEMNALMQPSA